MQSLPAQTAGFLRLGGDVAGHRQRVDVGHQFIVADDGSPSRLADDEPAALDFVVDVTIRKAEADQIADGVEGLRGRRLHRIVSTVDVDGDIIGLSLSVLFPQYRKPPTKFRPQPPG